MVGVYKRPWRRPLNLRRGRWVGSLRAAAGHVFTASQGSSATLSKQVIRSRLITQAQSPSVRKQAGMHKAASDAVGSVALRSTALLVRTNAVVSVPTVARIDASYWIAGASAIDSAGGYKGSDLGASVDLLDGRVLWLLGDSFVGASSPHGDHFVRNTVGLQSGGHYDLSLDTMTFYAGSSGIGSAAPDSFFPQRSVQGEACWFWAWTGLMLDGKLILWLSREITDPDAGFGFRGDGWDAILIDNPSGTPDTWKIRWCDVESETGWGVTSFIDGGDGYVYTLATGNQKCWPVRWKRANLKVGDFHNPQWWRGSGFGYMPDEPGAPPRHPISAPLRANQGPESVFKRGSTWIITACTGFAAGVAELDYATAGALEGPYSSWQSIKGVYGLDPNMTLAASNYIAYHGKAHPEQTWSGKGPTDLLMSYASSGAGGHSTLTDAGIGWIRPVKCFGLV